MYLVQTKALAIELKNGSLPESEKFKYFLGGTILTMFHYQLMILNGSGGYSLQTIIYGLLNIFIVVIGLVFLFKTNKSGDNLNFIERFVCLSFLVSIKILLLRFFIYIVYLLLLGGILNASSNWISEDNLRTVYTIFGYVTMFLYYFLMYKNIEIASRVAKEI